MGVNTTADWTSLCSDWASASAPSFWATWPTCNSHYISSASLFHNLNDATHFRFGRKKVLVAQFFIEMFFIVGMALSNNVMSVIVLRFIVSIFNMGKYPLAVTFGESLRQPF